MAKKRVPDWLNSPLWSSPSDHHRFSAAPEPPEEPPSPPSPPVPIKEDPPRIQDSRTNHNGIGTSPSCSSSASSTSASSSVDGTSHSRQAQLLAEVSPSLLLML